MTLLLFNSLLSSPTGGGLLRSRFNDSLSQALKSLYPEHDWLEWKFSVSSRRFWQTRENQRRFLEHVADRQGFECADFDSWYSINQQDIIDLGGAHLLHLHGDSLVTLIQAVFPDHRWDLARFRSRETTEEKRK
jgi:hypothetical protein